MGWEYHERLLLGLCTCSPNIIDGRCPVEDHQRERLRLEAERRPKPKALLDQLRNLSEEDWRALEASLRSALPGG